MTDETYLLWTFSEDIQSQHQLFNAIYPINVPKTTGGHAYSWDGCVDTDCEAAKAVIQTQGTN